MNEKQLRDEMDKAVDIFKDDISLMRTGRATPQMVENIVVGAYGGAQRLKIMELANINAPDPQSLVIDPWDKSIIGDIKKGIELANLGLSPNIDGEIIRIAVPPMTSEDRQKFVKLLSTKLENSKVAIRQIRGDAMKEIKDNLDKKEISEDDSKRLETQVQKITDEFNEKLEEISENKEKELLQV